MTKGKHLFVLTLLSLTTLFGCNDSTTTSDNSSNDSVSSSEFIRTENLTEEMLNSFKKGYDTTFKQSTEYDDNTSSSKILTAKCNEKNYETATYYDKDATFSSLGKRSYFYHYQINPTEETEMLYSAGLSVGNKIIYTPVMGEDKYTYEEIPLTWEESYLSNVFIDLTSSYFTRVGDENKFKLSLNDLDESIKETISSKLSAQLYGDKEILDNTSIDSFFLLTNGNNIVGFELNYLPYTLYDATSFRSSNGVFNASGEDVVTFCTPLQGQEDVDFENAMKKLRTQNYHLEETQQSFDYTTEKFVSQGKYTADFYNKESVVYNYYSANGKKYMSYGYLRYQEKENCKLGIVPINGQYYQDYLYEGSLDDLLPSFDISSILFIKDGSSTTDKLVYKLNRDIDISLENNDSVFTPFDADGYLDRIINLTITIENDKINIHNETSDTGESGLILDVNYTNFGKVENIVTSDKFHETTEGLKWSEILSNNEANVNSIIKIFTKDLLDSIPTITAVSNIYSDVSSSSKPVLYFLVYDKQDSIDLLSSYGNELVKAGFTLDESTIGEKLEESSPNYYKSVTVNNRKYRLNVTLNLWWNSIQDWGQFQVQLSFTADK